MTKIEQHEITWNSGHVTIRIGITFDTSYGIVEHLVVQSLEPENAPLPITGTGYRSHFVPPGTVEAYGGPLAATKTLLDEAAALPEWQEYLSSVRQGSLF
ncbi:hypothetical protein FEM03_08115 [Phragmitibacter flavus]|uniref:Uncharacterized protein n=1 Tax=Phragmitibacter flavus TaxID=2576071 RepID=A0A5R8KGQ7_9BACT|nr:hypothetical protein [Phragmitibacter flavus]TLD71480.1 hypothetical protein FEM03_08115 [Phragmitibacter flavus]